MGRSGYTDDFDESWQLVMYRGQVASAIRGKRGQAFLRELLEALDAMPEKRLITNDLRDHEGEVCALGSVGVKRGIKLEALDSKNHNQLAIVFGVARQLIQEIEFENDEAHYYNITPEKRWQLMRDWTAQQIKAQP